MFTWINDVRGLPVCVACGHGRYSDHLDAGCLECTCTVSVYADPHADVAMYASLFDLTI